MNVKQLAENDVLKRKKRIKKIRKMFAEKDQGEGELIRKTRLTQCTRIQYRKTKKVADKYQKSSLSVLKNMENTILIGIENRSKDGK